MEEENKWEWMKLTVEKKKLNALKIMTIKNTMKNGGRQKLLVR